MRRAARVDPDPVRQGTLRTLVLSLAVTLVACTAAQAATFTPNRVIVAFKPRALASERAAARAGIGAGIVSGAVGSPRTELLAVHGSVPATLARLRRSPAVAYAEPDYSYRYDRRVND